MSQKDTKTSSNEPDIVDIIGSDRYEKELSLFLKGKPETDTRFNTLVKEPMEFVDGQINLDLIYATQDVVAFDIFTELVAKRNVNAFIDVGSRLHSILFFARYAKCWYVECRPMGELPKLFNIQYLACEAQQLSAKDNDVPLITSLHALEHFGLGRYGDTVQYDGDVKGLEEFHRVLVPGGFLVLSVPFSHPDHPRIEFNGQRVYSKEIMDKMLSDAGFEPVHQVFITFPRINYSVSPIHRTTMTTDYEDIRGNSGFEPDHFGAYLTLSKKPDA
jgi:SAM-dependent methyltransferase